MSLHSATKAVQQSSNPAEELRLADRYIYLYNKAPKRFLLPTEHTYLKPIIDVYAGNLDGWREYIKGFWEYAVSRYGPNSGISIGIYEFSRTVDIRYAQQLRRIRLNRAAEWMKQTRPDLDAETRRVWLRRLEQEWAAERLEFLRQARASKGDGLTEEERTDVLNRFWATLDERLDHHQLPSYEDLCQPGAIPP